MAPPKRQKRSKKDTSNMISLRDFRQWLTGVEDMSGDDWVPDQKQWAIIRAKINDITESAIVEKQPAPVASQTPSIPVPLVIGEQQPSTDFSAMTIPVPSGRSAPISAKPNSMMASLDESGMPTVTPDIDTSSGGYNSGFA